MPQTDSERIEAMVKRLGQPDLFGTSGEALMRKALGESQAEALRAALEKLINDWRSAPNVHSPYQICADQLAAALARTGGRAK